MNILRSPLQWLIQSTSNFETPVDDKVVCEDDSHVIDIEEGLVMATGPSTLSICSTSTPSTTPEPPYQIKIVPGKSLGLVANRPISAGDLIISEAPLLQMKVSEMGYYRLEWEVNRLTPEKKDHFWKLHYTGMEELPELFEIWRKNSFSSGNGYQSVFGVISRINNSCTPNASVSWLDGPTEHENDEDYKGKMNVFAVKDIEQGEEITVCYTSVLHSRNARFEVLQEIWEFSCRCHACSLKGDDLMISERRRRRAASILDGLDYEDKDSRRIFKLVKEGLEILEEEGLSGHFFSLSWFAYQYASLHGQWEEAKYWAGQAYEHSKLINGEEHSSTIICKHGVHTPQCHLTRGRPWGSSVVSECIVA